MNKQAPRKPAAFNLEDVKLAADDEMGRAPLLVSEPDPFAQKITPADETEPRRHGGRWLRLFFAALGGLITLAFGLAIDNLVRSLFERTDWLGWTGLALTALALMALVVLAVREAIGLIRLRRITHIQELSACAVADDHRALARESCGELIAMYGSRPETARGRTALAGHLEEIIDGRDLVGLAETELLKTLDDEARRIVLNSAKRVSVVTAISPRALVDVLFVLTEILRLIRRLATLYGGRPGMLGFLRLTRRSISHLAITGGMAAGESMMQQILGHGIAARISTRLGEGVINGILTARVGIAAVDVCRPLPFVFARQLRLSDIVAELTRRAPEDEKDTPESG